METKIFLRDGETWTRFKVKIREVGVYAYKLKKYVDVDKPVRQSSRYAYYEVKGDLLNDHKQKAR